MPTPAEKFDEMTKHFVAKFKEEKLGNIDIAPSMHLAYLTGAMTVMCAMAEVYQSDPLTNLQALEFVEHLRNSVPASCPSYRPELFAPPAGGRTC